ncbi:MAG: orotidine-5-phosphate decarboxylase [Actinomycetia bacterium]|nr:orotidine-5-phosphate decarboxylase [Actinomycetes bacterium]
MSGTAEVLRPTTARERLVLALDVGGLAEAEAVAVRVGEWFATVKVGMELYAEAGPAAIDRMHELGFRVFLDLKLHDIPNTVERAARVHGRRGVEFLTLHAAGGEAMLRAGVEGLADGARRAGRPEPISLGVTVLTSESDTRAFPTRLAAAARAGCGGVVCSAAEVGDVRATYPHLATMVPGVRLPGDDVGDQVRVATPAAVVERGGDWLVIGRAVTAADDPEAAAARVADSIRGVAGAIPRADGSGKP